MVRRGLPKKGKESGDSPLKTTKRIQGGTGRGVREENRGAGKDIGEIGESTAGCWNQVAERKTPRTFVRRGGNGNPTFENIASLRNHLRNPRHPGLSEPAKKKKHIEVGRQMGLSPVV